jgi:hypothetical protein
MRTFSDYDEIASVEYGYQARLMYPDRKWEDVAPKLNTLWHREPRSLSWEEAQRRMREAFSNTTPS